MMMMTTKMIKALVIAVSNLLILTNSRSFELRTAGENYKLPSAVFSVQSSTYAHSCFPFSEKLNRNNFFS